MDCYCDYEPAQVYRSDTRKARKQYRCYECGGIILPSEVHEYHFGVFCGDPFTGRTCSRCVAIREWMQINVPCFCWAHGNMIDDARTTAQDAYEQAGDEVAGLRFGLLRRIVMRDKFNKARKEETAS